MSKGVLIFGGSVAGLQAALNLADTGITVHLVEAEPFLGADGGTTIPGHLLNTRKLEAARHPNVSVWTNTRINRTEGEAGRFHVELRRHPRYVDLSKCTACGDCITVCPVTIPGTDHKAIYLDGQPGCAAIDKLGKAPCANTCPGGVHVQGYVALIAQGRFQEAIDLIREAIPFPGICGRVCTHPCEVNCRRSEVDTPVAIRLLKRFVSDWDLAQAVDGSREAGGGGLAADGNRLADGEGQKVAVVGAGPGGMAVADQLARKGYRVTVFEKLPVIGGMMAVGIPEYRLPREVIAREYQEIQDLGVEVRLNTAIGPDGQHDLDDLFDLGYAAVCLAIGAHKSQGLRIPGADLPGVVHGIELLKEINLGQKPDDPDDEVEWLQQLLPLGADTRVAVLGGGNTAMDVSRSLKRFGLDDVRILYRRTRVEMPAMPEEIEDAEQENVTLEYLVSPVRVLDDGSGRVTGLECIRMVLGEPDASGRRRPVPVADSEFIVELDMVVLAIGQTPDLGFLGEGHGVAITSSERVNVAETSFMTSRPGVFAAGDAVTRDKMAVIEAIGMGKKAAAAIDAYLRGEQPHEVVVDAREMPVARREMAPDELAPKPAVPVPRIPVAARLSSYAEVELGFSAEQAVAEAQRCLVCGPCSECLACERVCKTGAVIHEQHETFTALDIGAIIYADDPAAPAGFTLEGDQGIYRVPPEDALLGSAAAARAMRDLRLEAQPVLAALDLPVNDQEARTGVLICECGGAISETVDTQAVCARAAAWPGVVHASVLPFSCSAEAGQAIRSLADDHGLDRVVLAGCSCCSLDQVCYSCTYQRVRCKENLGLFALPIQPHPAEGGEGCVGFEFVNIREQCAWVHADDPQAATDKAILLVAAGVARAGGLADRLAAARPIERSVLVLGGGAAARTCRAVLGDLGITVQQVAGSPERVHRAGGLYVAEQGERIWRASALVLVPRDALEAERLLDHFGEDGHRPQLRKAWGGLDTHRPGVYYCDPDLHPVAAGAAAAARAAAWLGRVAWQGSTIAAVVDPARCRACGTCVEICEYGAPELVIKDGPRAAWIDPAICTGCGTCAAHCPSGAITAGYVTEAQLETMLEAALV